MPEREVLLQINNAIMAIDPNKPPMDRHPKQHQGINPLLMTMRQELHCIKKITFTQRRKKLFDLLMKDFSQEEKELRQVGLSYINEVN